VWTVFTELPVASAIGSQNQQSVAASVTAKRQFMNVIPVIDLLNGVVVRGVAGQRQQYRPIQSQIAASPDPSIVMRSLCEAFDVPQMYIADLDAIQQGPLNRCTIAELTRADVPLLVDRGVRDADDVAELLDLGVAQAIVALETLDSLATAQRLIEKFGSEVLVLSLDLRDSELMTSADEWRAQTPENVAAQLWDVGFRQFIVLDVATVGTGGGPSTLNLCQRLQKKLPGIGLTTGGGVRNFDDLRQMKDCGIDSALVASALHDGRLTADDVNRIANR